MAEEYSDASLLLPGSDPLLRTEPVNGGLAGARAGSTLGGLTSPTLARFLLPKRRSIRPRCLRPRPTGGWLSSSAGQRRLRACTLLRRSAFLKLTSRCALTKLAVRNGQTERRARPETSCSRSRSRAMAIAARRTTTSPVETHRGGRRQTTIMRTQPADTSDKGRRQGTKEGGSGGCQGIM